MFYLQVPSTNEKLGDITNAVLDLLSTSCAECGITNDIIDEQSFACFPESPTYVTYRARLEGTSEINSTSLISLIEEWVSNGSNNIVMAGVLMTVNSECSVVISSLNEGNCFPSTESTATNTDSTITVMTGGVVAVIFIISLTIAAVIIAVSLIMKKMSVKE